MLPRNQARWQGWGRHMSSRLYSVRFPRGEGGGGLTISPSKALISFILLKGIDLPDDLGLGSPFDVMRCGSKGAVERRAKRPIWQGGAEWQSGAE